MIKKVLIVFCVLFSFNYTHLVDASTKNREEYEKLGKVFWDVNLEEKFIALTFDDGPHPAYTPQILDVLLKHQAKATFFVMGAHAKKYPDIIKRQAVEGHEIGNHTFNHIYHQKNSDQLKDELDDTKKAIHEITGKKTNLFRPVGGIYNDLIIHTAIENGYDVIMWSWHQDTKDWKSPSVNNIVNHVTSNVQPGDIVLLHDAGGNRSQTVKALDEVLTVLKEEGYQFVTVSELIKISHTKYK